MRVDLYGVVFETPRVTFYLWSPWRSAALEHRLFEAVRALPRVAREESPVEWCSSCGLYQLTHTFECLIRIIKVATAGSLPAQPAATDDTSPMPVRII